MLLASFVAALNVADKINQFGAYAGLAAIVGLGVLSLLYFSQAREVKRLREWAGRAPERAAELEAAAQQRGSAASPRLAAHPQAAQTGPQPAPRPPSTTVSPAQPLSAAGATGAALTAAGAPKPAGAAPGPAQPIVPADASAAQDTAIVKPTGAAPVAPAPAGPAVPATPAAAAPAVPAVPVPASPAPATPAPAAPSASTPAAARPAPVRPPAAAPLRNPAPVSYQPQSSRSRGEAQRDLGVEGRSPLGTTVIVVGGVIVVALLVFLLVTQVFGGGDKTPVPNTVASATTATTAKKKTTAKKSAGVPTVVRGNTNVVVLNGTLTNGLAATQASKLTGAGFKAPYGTNTGNQSETATTVYFAETQRAAADEVVRVLGLPASSVRALDANTKAIAEAVPGGANPDVVVVVGSDRAG